MAAPVQFPSLGPQSPMTPMFGESRPGGRLSVVSLDGAALDEARGAGIANADESGAARGVHKPFTDFLKAQVENVNSLQKEADTAVAAMVTGQSGNLHETMIALDKADVSFRMMTKVRTKIIDAYHEVMRMNI